MATKKDLSSLGYNVLHTIGEGTFGTVKLAKSENYPDKVAIKIMDRKYMSSYAYQQCMLFELSILRNCRHPHIIHVHETYVRPSGQIFIVMEAAAMDLTKKIRKLGRIPPDQARLWFSQLVSAMVYIHNKNIVHRDLKCDNVLLTADDQVRLTDFGAGCYTYGFPDLSETLCGTPPYCAPEMLMGKCYDAKKSDVWSLGVILYIMVTGSLPFISGKIKTLCRLQLKPLKFPRKITVEESCRDLITSMLCYNPFQRPNMTTVEKHPWLKPKKEQQETDEETAAADTPTAVAETSPEEKELETQTTEKTEDQQTQREEHNHSAEGDVPKDGLEQKDLSTSRDLQSPVVDDLEQDNKMQSLEKISRVSTEFPETAVSKGEEDDQEEEGGVNGSQAGEKAAEIVEESSAPCCGAFCTAVKRAAKAHVVAPIVRGSRALLRKIKKMFRRKSTDPSSSSDSQQGAPPPADPTEAPISEDATPSVLEKEKTEPKVNQEKRRQKFKILKKKTSKS